MADVPAFAQMMSAFGHEKDVPAPPQPGTDAAVAAAAAEATKGATASAEASAGKIEKAKELDKEEDKPSKGSDSK